MLASTVVLFCMVAGMFQEPGELPASEREREAILEIVEELETAEFQEWVSKAESGDLRALVIVGLAYRDGKGVDKNARVAVGWLERASAQGSSQAQYLLAKMYIGGKGVSKNVERGLELGIASATHGNVRAQHALALAYDTGGLVEKDHRESARWYQMAAEGGYAPSQFNLAMAYTLGEGVRKDYPTAISWLEKSSERGFAAATYYLGRMHFEHMVPGSRGNHAFESAVAAWKKAAEQGYPQAALNLGELYSDRRLSKQAGGPDLVEACMWFEVAQVLDERGEWTDFIPGETKRLRTALAKKRPKLLKRLNGAQRETCMSRAEALLRSSESP